MKSPLFKLIALAMASIALTAQPAQAGRRMIEIGVDVAGGAAATPWDPSEVAGVFTTSGTVDFNFLFLSASADANYSRVGDSDVVEIQADGAIAFAKLQELYYRNGGPNGDMSRVFAGVGGKIGFGSVGDLTLSVGAAALDWQRRDGGPQSILGGYAGGKLYLHIWKVENDLRVAYYMAPTFNEDQQAVALEGAPLVTSWQQGWVASDHLRIDAFKVSIFHFGPELRARMAELPDGVEWTATVGIGGRIGLL